MDKLYLFVRKAIDFNKNQPLVNFSLDGSMYEKTATAACLKSFVLAKERTSATNFFTITEQKEFTSLTPFTSSSIVNMLINCKSKA